MAEYTLVRELTIRRPITEVFDFFSNAFNLEKITPPELKFHIFTEKPIHIEKGTLIDYMLRIRGFRIRWRTEISEWNPPFEFIDRQIRGPYKQWIHRHTFKRIDADKTLIGDQVRYRLPLEPLGDLAHFFIRLELDRIFDYRQKAVAKILM